MLCVRDALSKENRTAAVRAPEKRCGTSTLREHVFPKNYVCLYRFGCNKMRGLCDKFTFILESMLAAKGSAKGGALCDIAFTQMTFIIANWAHKWQDKFSLFVSVTWSVSMHGDGLFPIFFSHAFFSRNRLRVVQTLLVEADLLVETDLRMFQEAATILMHRFLQRTCVRLSSVLRQPTTQAGQGKKNICLRNV